VIAKCQQSNTAARKELDWQGQLEALMDARRLVAHHAEVSFQQQPSTLILRCQPLMRSVQKRKPLTNTPGAYVR
jgi:hypothetical protein